MIKKIILTSIKIIFPLIGLAFLSLVFVLFLSSYYRAAPEKYYGAESYILQIPYSQSDSIIKSVKEKYAEYQPEIRAGYGYEYYTGDEDGKIRFYMPNIGYEVECVTFPMVNPDETHLLLITYTNLKQGSEFKFINYADNLNPLENELAIENFEKEILPKIGKWRHYHNWFLRWLKVR